MVKSIVFAALLLCWPQLCAQQESESTYITALTAAAQKAEEKIHNVSDAGERKRLKDQLNENYLAFFLSSYFDKGEFSPGGSELDLMHSIYGSFGAVMKDYEKHFKRTGDNKVKDAIFQQCQMLLRIYPVGSDRFSTEDVFLMQHLAQCMLYDVERLRTILGAHRENQVALVFLTHMGDKDASLAVSNINHKGYPKFKNLFDIYIKKNHL